MLFNDSGEIIVKSKEEISSYIEDRTKTLEKMLFSKAEDNVKRKITDSIILLLLFFLC